MCGASDGPLEGGLRIHCKSIRSVTSITFCRQFGTAVYANEGGILEDSDDSLVGAPMLWL